MEHSVCMWYLISLLDVLSCSANLEDSQSPMSSVIMLNNIHPAFRLLAWLVAPKPC